MALLSPPSVYTTVWQLLTPEVVPSQIDLQLLGQPTQAAYSQLPWIPETIRPDFFDQILKMVYADVG